MTDIHEKMMRKAVALAARGVGKTRPNPAVGCVIVKDGKIVGTGWHRKAGTPHAEIHALREAGDAARGADVYVTLEPCSHHGKTPPCVDALIEAGVGRVFAGMIDPNPLVSGRGMKILSEAGIPGETGILEDECRKLNLPFIKHIATGLPFVMLKLAMSLDAKIATTTGDSKWITCEESRSYVHKIRGFVDAVLVGADTVIADNPLLNVRLAKGSDPVRVVVDSRLRTPTDAAVYNPATGGSTILATINSDTSSHRRYPRGTEVVCCAEKDGRVDLADLLVRLGERGLQSVLIEGGGTIAGEALRCGLVDKVCLFYAPIILGGDGIPSFAGVGASLVAEAARIRDMSVRIIGTDLLVEGYPEKPCSQV